MKNFKVIIDLEKLSVRELEWLASKTSDKRTLIELSNGNYHNDVKKQVAINSSAPKKALKILSKSKESDIKNEVACNLNTPKKTLAKLAKDDDILLCCIARNPNTLRRTRIRLAVDESILIQHEAKFYLYNRPKKKY